MRPRLQFRAPQAATPISCSCVQVLRRRARPEAARGAAAGAQRLLLLARGPVRLVLPPLAPRAARPAQLGGGGARGRAARRAQRGGGVARAPAWPKSPCWQAAEQGLVACGSRRPRPRVRRPSGLRRRARAARAPRCRPGASPSRRRRRRFRCASHSQELEPECKWPLLSAAWQVDSAALVALRLATPAAWEARLSVWAALRTPKARLCRPDRGGATKLLILHRSTPRRRYSPRRWGGAERPRHGSRRAGALTRSAPPTTTTKWRARKRGTRTRRPARATGLGCGRVSPVNSSRSQRYSLIEGARNEG